MATQDTKSMVSEVSICNQALSWVGKDQINFLTEENARAEWCRNNYTFLRDAVLEERMWTFASVRVEDTTADKDPFGVQFSHVIPTGWLSVYNVYRNVDSIDPSSWQESKGWRKEGTNILTREETVFLWGIERVSDTGKFTSLFVQALAARLAADMAITMTQNRQLQADAWALYAEKLSNAAVRDGQQGANVVIQSERLISARHGSGGFING